jgi:hypothetical protein
LQRYSGVIAFAFILWHVSHRGWLNFSWWMEHVTRPLGGGTFDAARAAATASIQDSLIVKSSMVDPQRVSWPTGCGRWASPGPVDHAALPAGPITQRLGLAAGIGALFGMATVVVTQ